MAFTIGICGITGKMGKALAEEISKDKRWECRGGTSRQHAGSTALSKATGIAGLEGEIKSSPQLFEESQIVIDFTTPEALEVHLKLAQRYKTKLVIGTTGLNQKGEEALKETAKEIPLVWSSNMSIGVTLLTALVEKAAHILDSSYDIEIYEQHHRAKKDAPSGTALMLAGAAQQGRERENDPPQWVDHIASSKPRKIGEIGIASSRAGGAIGRHEVSFTNDSETLLLGHTAFNRALFAQGSLKAAWWLMEKDPKPALYSMRDVLGLHF